MVKSIGPIHYGKAKRGSMQNARYANFKGRLINSIISGVKVLEGFGDLHNRQEQTDANSEVREASVRYKIIILNVGAFKPSGNVL
tara:strand:+ start:7811 stop:8065 length:255 start_codon:yes stop_codon:yes gene_type:complete